MIVPLNSIKLVKYDGDWLIGAVGLSESEEGFLALSAPVYVGLKGNLFLAKYPKYSGQDDMLIKNEFLSVMVLPNQELLAKYVKFSGIELKLEETF